MKSIIFIFLFYYGFVYPQISPGELSKVHSNLEGISNCTKCHTLGEGLSNQKCLDCHKEIKLRIEKNSGYHSSAEVKSKYCWNCHSEHNGRNFKIINFNPGKFDHKKTGYILTGKHKTIECSDCHQSKFIKETILKKDKTYLGLDKNCSSCHWDIHQKSAGNNCESCHNTSSFKSFIMFDHNKTNFPLLGSHKNVQCVDCHKKTNDPKSPTLLFTSYKNPKCSECHIDVHQNKFGNNCLNCHNFNSFRTTSKQKFDHSKTNFPLVGKHQFVDCKECHKGKLIAPLEFSHCYNCHYDFHKGQFVKNSSIQDCKECHTEDGFSPSNFTIEQHQNTKFILTGAHLAIECKGCHYNQKGWKFKFTSFKCVICHENVHKDEITLKFMGNHNCENCHNTINWKVIKFEHGLTQFALSGKHSKIECRDCHIKEINNLKFHLFKSLKTDCLSCHENYHYEQYLSNECTNCHSFEFWTPTTFEHDNAQFKLKGAHEKVECIKCHPIITRNNGKTFVLFKTRRLKCIDCHSS